MNSKSSTPERPATTGRPDIRLTEDEIRRFIADMDAVDELAANISFHLQTMEMWLKQNPKECAPWLIGHAQSCQWLIGQLQGHFELHGDELIKMSERTRVIFGHA